MKEIEGLRGVDAAALGRLDLGAQLDQERVNAQRPAYSSGRLVSARTKQRHGEAGLERGGEELGGWQQAALGMPASVEDGAPGSVDAAWHRSCSGEAGGTQAGRGQREM